MGIGDERCQHVGILSRERGVSKSGVRRVYGPSVRGGSFGHEGLCRLVQSGLGLRVCGAVEGDGLSTLVPEKATNGGANQEAHSFSLG